MIVEPAGIPRRAGGEIVAAGHRGVAGDAAAAAKTAAPRGPALLEARLLHRRSLDHLGIGERDVVGQCFALRRKAERRPIRAADAAAAVDERIEHQPQELIRYPERSAGRRSRPRPKSASVRLATPATAMRASWQSRL